MVIDNLPEVFDSHKFIHTLLITCPGAYGQELVDGCKDKKGSVATVNGQIALFLKDNRIDLGIFPIVKVTSPNILGNDSECMLWSKTRNIKPEWE